MCEVNVELKDFSEALAFYDLHREAVSTSLGREKMTLESTMRRWTTTPGELGPIRIWKDDRLKKQIEDNCSLKLLAAAYKDRHP